MIGRRDAISRVSDIPEPQRTNINGSLDYSSDAVLITTIMNSDSTAIMLSSLLEYISQSPRSKLAVASIALSSKEELICQMNMQLRQSTCPRVGANSNMHCS